MTYLGTQSLRERGLADLGPIALDELTTLSKHADWAGPGEPTPALLEAARAAVTRTAARLAAE